MTPPADVRAPDVRVGRGRLDPGIDHARRRFGGIDVPASLVGVLTAIALLSLLGGLAAAALGTLGYQTAADAEEATIGGFIAGVVVLAAAFFLGGWAAGRMARYDGARNGFMTAVWALLLAALVAGLAAWLGDEYDVFSRFGLPQWFSSDSFRTTAIVSGLISLVVMFGAAIAGGIRGETYHHRVDSWIVSTRPGGITETHDTRVLR